MSLWGTFQRWRFRRGADLLALEFPELQQIERAEALVAAATQANGGLVPPTRPSTVRLLREVHLKRL